MLQLFDLNIIRKTNPILYVARRIKLIVIVGFSFQVLRNLLESTY